MTTYPLSVSCSGCGADAGRDCTTRSGFPARPHARRARLALVLAADADSALDAYFPRLGPCGICGTPGLDQRHRVVDAIAGMLEAGEDPEDTAGEYGVTPEAVEVVTLWMVRWPGAWL